MVKLLLMLALLQPINTQVDPGGGISPSQLKADIAQLNEDIVQFYSDAIDWGVEAGFRYLAYMGGAVLAIKIFKG